MVPEAIILEFPGALVHDERAEPLGLDVGVPQRREADAHVARGCPWPTFFGNAEPASRGEVCLWGILRSVGGAWKFVERARKVSLLLSKGLLTII